MIKAVHIQNFQSHKDTYVEFGKNVNIFIGFSDSGKTAIIRALRWVITNKPSGDAFRSNWGGTTSVELTLQNGTSIIRRKGSSLNEYVLNITGDDELVFKAFGTDVPVEIVNVLAFDSINLQEQLDAPYLFSETPGAVAKHFNKIADLEKIDIGIQRIQSKINTLNSAINTSTSNITTYKTELKTWDFLEEFENKLVILERKTKSKDELKRSWHTLNKLQASLEEVLEEQYSYSEIVKDESTVLLALIKYDQLSTHKQNLKKLKGVVNLLANNAAVQESVTPLLSTETIIDKLLKLIKDLKALRQEQTNFVNLTNRIASLRKRQESMLKTLELIEEEFHRDFPAICPLCNSKIK